MRAETPIITLQNVCVMQEQRTILQSISLEFFRHELCLILGPNGAGKSSLLRAISSTIALQTGEVTIQQKRIQSLSPNEIARLVAVVPQEVPLVTGFSVRDVVAMGRAPYQGTWLHASKHDDDIVERCLIETELCSIADRSFESLSGGERKRVMMAQAWAQDTPVLLLDEPTAFADLRHTLKILEQAHRRVQSGCCVILVLHDLNLAMSYADRVILMAKGHVVDDGSPKNILTLKRVSAVYDVPLVELVDPKAELKAFVPVLK